MLIKNKKILLIDFDVNKNIQKILTIKNKNKKNKLIENKYNKKIYLLNLNNKNCDKKEIKKIIEEKRKEYEIIILDDPKMFLNEIQNIIDINIVLSEANLIQINSTKKIIEELISKYNIQKNKIKIIFNKYNFFSIDFNLLKNIFSKNIKTINQNNKYNLIINKNIKIIDKKIKKDYLKIIKEII